jgi:hypothetical protein
MHRPAYRSSFLRSRLAHVQHDTVVWDAQPAVNQTAVALAEHLDLHRGLWAFQEGSHHRRALTEVTQLFELHEDWSKVTAAYRYAWGPGAIQGFRAEPAHLRFTPWQSATRVLDPRFGPNPLVLLVRQCR